MGAGTATEPRHDGRDLQRNAVADPARPHLDFLDALRGIAILGVVLVHVTQTVHGLPRLVEAFGKFGLHGVQLFFVVSGFTLALNHFGRPLDPVRFALRRVFRIAPMFYVGAALYLLLGAVSGIAAGTRDVTPAQILLTLLFLHGWTPGTINKVVPGGWSIAAEAMFYVLFPFLLSRLRGVGSSTIAVGCATVLAAASLVGLRRYSPGSAEEVGAFGFYFWLTQLPAFVVGCSLVFTTTRFGAHRRAAQILVFASVAGLTAAAAVPALANFLLIDGLLGILVGASAIARPRWLGFPPLVLLGKVSFSLYILHFAVVGFGQPWIEMLVARTGSLVALPISYAAVILVGGAASWLTHRWIETPMIAVGRLLSSRLRP